jgi:hypothetical protein
MGGLRAGHTFEVFMSVIYLRHPIHGAKVAISEEEANNDAVYGWERFDIASLNLNEEVNENETETDEVDSVNEMATPKRGRRRAS